MSHYTPIKTRSKLVHTPVAAKQTRKNHKMEEELKRLKEEMAKFGDLREYVELFREQTVQNQQLAEKVEYLTTQNAEQRSLLDRMNSGDRLSHRVNETISVSGLLNSLQQTHIDAKAPEFTDEEVMNPVEYLENLESYFNLKDISERCKLPIIESKLQGKSKVWWDANKGLCTSYAEFKTLFLQKFYSIPIQIKIKNKWSSKRYKSQDGSLQTYFFKQLRDAKYFVPKLDQYEINYTIVQTLPWRVRDALATVNLADTKAVESAISYLDSCHEDREKERRSYQNNQHNNSPNSTVRSLQLYSPRQQAAYQSPRDNNHSNMYSQSYTGRMEEFPMQSSQYSQQYYQHSQPRHSVPIYQDSPSQIQLPNIHYPPPQLFPNNNQNLNGNRNLN